jgi:hypothetical protein
MQPPVFIERTAFFDDLDFMITPGEYGGKYSGDSL